MPGMEANACSPDTLEARQMDCHEFKVNLEYRVSFSPASTIESNSVSNDKRIQLPSRYGTEVYMNHKGLQPKELGYTSPVATQLTAGNIKIEHEVMKVFVSLLYGKCLFLIESGWVSRCSETLQRLRTCQR
jgi:hypothetical protein